MIDLLPNSDAPAPADMPAFEQSSLLPGTPEHDQAGEAGAFDVLPEERERIEKYQAAADPWYEFGECMALAAPQTYRNTTIQPVHLGKLAEIGALLRGDNVRRVTGVDAVMSRFKPPLIITDPAMGMRFELEAKRAVDYLVGQLDSRYNSDREIKLALDAQGLLMTRRNQDVLAPIEGTAPKALTPTVDTPVGDAPAEVVN